MKTLFATLAALLVTGCASLNNAGTAEYSIKPFVADKQTVCCEVIVKNGKEYASLRAKVVKQGDNYSVELDETGVAAFKGQEIVGSAVGSTVTTAATAATTAAKTAATGEVLSISTPLPAALGVLAK